jgi:hypothetical protein
MFYNIGQKFNDAIKCFVQEIVIKNLQLYNSNIKKTSKPCLVLNFYTLF